MTSRVVASRLPTSARVHRLKEGSRPLQRRAHAPASKSAPSLSASCFYRLLYLSGRQQKVGRPTIYIYHNIPIDAAGRQAGDSRCDPLQELASGEPEPGPGALAQPDATQLADVGVDVLRRDSEQFGGLLRVQQLVGNLCAYC